MINENHKEILNELEKLHIGDEIKLNNGKIAIFQRIRKTNFVVMINNETYYIPFKMYNSKIEN